LLHLHHAPFILAGLTGALRLSLQLVLGTIPSEMLRTSASEAPVDRTGLEALLGLLLILLLLL
jgi:hypothetical protein